MQTQEEVCFFRHEALKTQKYVADHELQHFLKIKNLYSCSELPTKCIWITGKV